MSVVVQVLVVVVVLGLVAVAVGRLYDRAGRSPFRRRDESTCPTCEGSGAIRKLGPIRPCPDCKGTGVRPGAPRS